MTSQRVQWRFEHRLYRALSAYARCDFHNPAKVRIVRTAAQLLGNGIVRFIPGSGRMIVDFQDYIGWALLTKGVFEPVSLCVAVELMRRADNGVFLDVGANHGLYTIAVGCSTGCEVVAVEPSSENFAALRRNVALNTSLKAKLVNCCACPRNTVVQLSAEDVGKRAWTKITNGDESGQPYIAGLQLDVMLQKLGVERINLLKIDVEGYELEVFGGLTWSGLLRPRYVLMECGPAEPQKSGFLIQRGYMPQSVDGGDIGKLAAYPEGNLLFIDREQSHLD